ncbi:MAG: DUF1349 domain-containing protein, partial [Bacteroidales bacterium]|nr:DUF1349 domain-containing protein [Bacteroidales bacterium]
MNQKSIFIVLALGLCFASSCTDPESTGTVEVFTDGVASALENGGQVNWDHLAWTREPAACSVSGDTLSVTTAPGTDLWQRTYYHFRNDNAPVFQMRTREQYFSFVVKTDFT